MEYTDEELLKLDPELDALFKKKGIPSLATPTRESVPSFRKFFNAAVKRYNNSPFAKAALGDAFTQPDWTEHDHTVCVRDGRTVQARSYTPNNVARDGAAVFVMMHGGGWFMGDLESEALWCRILASKLGLVVVNADYGLYPEVKFGVPALDCFDVVRWTASHATSFGGNPRKGFILGGSSGGGAYASIATYLARDEKLDPPVTGLFMVCPVLTDEYVDGQGNERTRFDHKTEFRSWWQNADAPLMSDKMRLSIREFADFEFDSPLLSPFHFQSHRDIPPTYIGVCGLDPWRDGGVLFKREIEKAGSRAKLDVYPGLPHCWWTTFPHLKATQTWLKQSLDGVRWLLEVESKVSKESKL